MTAPCPAGRAAVAFGAHARRWILERAGHKGQGTRCRRAAGPQQEGWSVQEAPSAPTVQVTLHVNGEAHQVAWSEPELSNAIHGLVRFAGWESPTGDSDRVEMTHRLWPSGVCHCEPAR